jgi:hypothetical protein
VLGKRFEDRKRPVGVGSVDLGVQPRGETRVEADVGTERDQAIDLDPGSLVVVYHAQQLIGPSRMPDQQRAPRPARGRDLTQEHAQHA